MITTRSLLTAFLLAPLFALIAMAQARPNFTGTWKLNQQKSKGLDGVTCARSVQYLVIAVRRPLCDFSISVLA
jgi:hypothetical protein